ncbi:MAG: TonB-dependent receptor, partial [Acidobacteria bacterium]
MSADRTAQLDVVLHFAVNADVTVTAKRTFTNLADVQHPEQDLVGIAQSASQGAIVARQLDERPLMRDGEVLEAVPGVIVTQHSGEGKANQYFLRGFNLDHGTDFATAVSGIPVNMPTHAHGQGYSDLNFLIPELITGVQFSKGPYYADQGDFATAGSSNINYATVLDRPIVHVEAGGEGYARALAAASPQVGSGHLVAALEVAHNDGPWVHPDDFQKVNGVWRYSQGDVINGWAVTAMGYHGRWNSTDQVAQRAIASGAIDRLGAIDPTDGGRTYRYSGSLDWQHGSSHTLTKITAYSLGYDLDLFSNFTYYLNDPVHGDQIEQADHRFVAGGKIVHRRRGRWA